MVIDLTYVVEDLDLLQPFTAAEPYGRPTAGPAGP